MIGTIGLDSIESSRTFTDEEIELAATIAAQVALVHENAEKTRQLENAAWISVQGAWGAYIAHDVNREAGAVRRILFILQQDPKLPQEIKEQLQEADRYAEALVLPMQFSPSSALTNPDKIVETEVAWAKKLWPQISWTTQIQAHNAQVRMNPWWFGRSLRHFLRNAAEAMPLTKVLKKVIVRTWCEEHTVILQVEDTGHGIPIEFQHLIFRQLIIKKEQNVRSGLFLVGATFERYGGSARLLWNRPGEGACFELRIPLDDGE